MLFLFLSFLTGATFLQFFSTVPLFYRDVHHLSEEYIGMLIGLNGLLIFLIEMPLIRYFEQPRFSIYRILVWSTLTIGMSFFVLNLTPWSGVLVIGMVLMTIGEMLNFPFSNRFAMDRAEHGKMGSYMALSTISFSCAHIVGHNTGFQLVDSFGFTVTWYIMTATLIVTALMTLWLRNMVKREALPAPEELETERAAA